MTALVVKLSQNLEYFGKAGSRVRFGSFGPRAAEMTALAQAAIHVINWRLELGRGSDDAPMPALKERYAKAKERMGLSGIRDLSGPGAAYSRRTVKTPGGGTAKQWQRVSGKGHMHMLDDLRITYVDDTTAKIDISTAFSRLKARANEQRAPWWGLSPRDSAMLTMAAGRIFKPAIEGVKLRFSFIRQPTISMAQPMWMDPLGLGNSRRRSA